jgi:DNA/RNA-binding domain of Phe-tRNA-synthetase-like protein
VTTSDCRLPDGRVVRIAAEIAPRVSAGVLAVAGVVVDDGDGPARAAAVLGGRLRDRWSGVAPGEIPGLAEARNLYKTFGMEPTRHRPSSEALLRRTLQGKGLYRISNLVDACNLASLEFLLPIGLYDLARIAGDVELRLGREGERYQGIRKGTVNLAGRLGFFDDRGPFGSPTSDSARTCTSEATTSVLAVVLATADYPARAMDADLDVLATLLAEHCAGREALRAVLGGAT